MHVLICIGGMPYSVPTIEFGGLVARLTGASVVLLNVAGSEDELAAGESALSTARDMLEGLDAGTTSRWGVAGTEILREAEAGGYDLVVIGARDVLSLAELFMGSIARRAVRDIPASVLVVRHGSTRLERMLICTDGSEHDEALIRIASPLAQAGGARVTLLHVSGPVPGMYKGLNAMQEQLDELLRTDTPIARHLRAAAAALERQGVQAQLKLRRGTVASEILLEADEGDYDLIVIGAAGPEQRARGLLTVDVTRQVVDRALRPVLAVRRPGPSSASRWWSRLKRHMQGGGQEALCRR
jgi:nucleotide-binding universal stress UspA family protein